MKITKAITILNLLLLGAACSINADLDTLGDGTSTGTTGGEANEEESGETPQGGTTGEGTAGGGSSEGGDSSEGGAADDTTGGGAETGDPSASMCDSEPTCEACGQCAALNDCSAQAAACEAEPDCVALLQCFGQCEALETPEETNACVGSCLMEHQQGAEVFAVYAECWLMDACPTACAMNAGAAPWSNMDVLSMSL